MAGTARRNEESAGVMTCKAALLLADPSAVFLSKTAHSQSCATSMASSATRVLERFQAKWLPVGVKKTRKDKELEPLSDAIRSEKALVMSLEVRRWHTKM
jgi:hypothetical protein